MKHPKIMIIDSGAGGLSIASEIYRRLPNSQLIQVADSARFPYGTKSKAQLTHIIQALCLRAYERFLPDIVVLACNTASTQALEDIRARLKVPVVGVVPAIKPASALTQSGIIGVLATEGTVTQSYTQRLIEDFAAHNTVTLHGTKQLVATIEHWARGKPLDIPSVQQELNQLCGGFTTMDTIVLACTHFPLIKPMLAQYLPHIKHWVDSGEAIARRVEDLLKAMPPAPTEQVSVASVNSTNLLVTTTANNPYDHDRVHCLLGNYTHATLT